MAKIIPASNLSFKGAGGQAERQMLNILKELPDEYFILRECKIMPSESKRATGSQEDRADFIVIGPEIGVLVLEIKDWNIRNNEYRFIDQINIEKRDKRSTTSTLVGNPWDQAEEYFHAIIEHLHKSAQARQLWVSYAVAYPKLTRPEFVNSFINPQPDNLQSNFIIDLKKTFFKDDLMGLHGILSQLKKYIIGHKQLGIQTLNYTREQVEAAVDWLIPTEMRVGGLPDYSEANKKLVYLDEEQQKWALSDAFMNKKYLSDVAGSGKTNVLLSRAIYWAKQRYESGGSRILITTYNQALQHELERIFLTKLGYDPIADYYKKSIDIYNIIQLMEDIVKTAWGNDFQRWKEAAITRNTESTYIEEILPNECLDILSDHPQQFEQYDYLLIDEVQDFSTKFLAIATRLLRNKESLFAVGDIGQKIFDRTVEWWDIDMSTDRVALQSRFLMYRNPQPIAKLAWKFLTADQFISRDLEDEKYSTKIKPKSPLHTQPVFIPFSNEDELLQHITGDIQDYLQSTLPQKILCIGLKDGLLQQLKQKLTNLGLPARWATEVSAKAGNYIVLADFVEAKGLEREYVFIVDSDHLIQKRSVFEAEEQFRARTKKDRIKLFIALTRAILEVRLYYVNRQHPFMKEISQIQAEMNR